MRLHDALDYHARERGDADFAIQNGGRLSYRRARAATELMAAALVGAGLEPGDRLAVLAKNSIEYLLLYYAASRAGVVPVPLNYRLAPAEWAWIVEDARVRLLIAGAEYVPAVDGLRDALG
jgi:acyl-CoA synthetase (AMP-forming)/AMP-acid ligase II